MDYLEKGRTGTLSMPLYIKDACKTLAASNKAAHGTERRINISADHSIPINVNCNLQGRHSSHSILSTRYLGVERELGLRQLNVHGIDDLLKEGNELEDSTETH